MSATEKQVNYALYLLAEAGFDGKFMSAKFAQLGASMKERSGTVRIWVENMERHEISELITRLLDDGH